MNKNSNPFVESSDRFESLINSNQQKKLVYFQNWLCEENENFYKVYRDICKELERSKSSKLWFYREFKYYCLYVELDRNINPNRIFSVTDSCSLKYLAKYIQA